MKPRIGAYLSKRTAVRLTAAAKRRGMTKSALVETALNRFLDSDDADNAVTLTGRLADLSGQIGQLDRDLGIVSEIVSLHARFHLAVKAEAPAETQRRACSCGSARCDEFAAPVERRVQRGASLTGETIDRFGTARASASADCAGEGGSPAVAFTAYQPDFTGPNQLDEMPEQTAAVWEDGSIGDFRVQPRSPLHSIVLNRPIQCRRGGASTNCASLANGAL